MLPAELLCGFRSAVTDDFLHGRVLIVYLKIEVHLLLLFARFLRPNRGNIPAIYIHKEDGQTALSGQCGAVVSNAFFRASERGVKIPQLFGLYSIY